MSSSSVASPLLPPELWSQVFDSLDFDPLLVVSRVCQGARSNARAHPTFWRDIELSKPTIGQLNLLHMRLSISQPESRLIALRIVLDGQLQHPSRPWITRKVLAEILTVMPRVTNLDIECIRSLDAGIRALMESPAPHLHTLRVCMLYDPRAMNCDDTLPPRLFAGNAPVLRCIELDGYYSAGDQPEHVFPSVQRVVCSSDLLEHLICMFPNVTDVFLGPPGLYPDDVEENARSFLLKVPMIAFGGSDEEDHSPSFEAIDFLAPRARYTLSDIWTSQLLLALEQLEGSLSLQYVRTEGTKRDPETFTFSSLTDGKVRVLIDNGYIDAGAASLFWSGEPGSAEMLRRVTQCTFTIGYDGDSAYMTFSDIRERVLQYLSSLTQITVRLSGTCEEREHQWSHRLELEDDIARQVELVTDGRELEKIIPYATKLRRIVVTGQNMSRSDAEGLVLVAGYFIERAGDVTVELQIKLQVEASVMQVLEAHFRAAVPKQTERNLTFDVPSFEFKPNTGSGPEYERDHDNQESLDKT